MAVSFAYGDKSGSNTKFCSGSYNSSGYETPTSLEFAYGANGKAKTEIAEYKLVSATKSTPWCSFDWFGNDTYCSDVISSVTISGPPLDLRNNTCTYAQPCNHFVNTTTGYDIKGLVYKFFLGHPKP